MVNKYRPQNGNEKKYCTYYENCDNKRICDGYGRVKETTGSKRSSGTKRFTCQSYSRGLEASLLK